MRRLRPERAAGLGAHRRHDGVAALVEVGRGLHLDPHERRLAVRAHEALAGEGRGEQRRRHVVVVAKRLVEHVLPQRGDAPRGAVAHHVLGIGRRIHPVDAADLAEARRERVEPVEGVWLEGAAGRAVADEDDLVVAEGVVERLVGRERGVAVDKPDAEAVVGHEGAGGERESGREREQQEGEGGPSAPCQRRARHHRTGGVLAEGVTGQASSRWKRR